jgi:DnaJ domain
LRASAQQYNGLLYTVIVTKWPSINLVCLPVTMKQPSSLLALVWSLFTVSCATAAFVRVPTKGVSRPTLPASTASTVGVTPLLVALICEDVGHYERAKRDRVMSTKRKASVEPTPARSLYEILGASPEATKAELKQRYVALAQKTHPDAIRHQSGRSGSRGATLPPNHSVDFSEVAHAYRILSDPLLRKRYDRELYAAKLVHAVCDSVERTSIFIGKVVLPELMRWSVLFLSACKRKSSHVAVAQHAYFAMRQQSRPTESHVATSSACRTHDSGYNEIAQAYRILSNPLQQRLDRRLQSANMVRALCESLERTTIFVGTVLLPELVRFTSILLSDPKKK